MGTRIRKLIRRGTHAVFVTALALLAPLSAYGKIIDACALQVVKTTDPSTCELKPKDEQKPCFDACSDADDSAAEASKACHEAAEEENKLMQAGALETKAIGENTPQRQDGNQLSNGDNTCSGQDFQQKRRKLGQVLPPNFEKCIQKAQKCNDKGGMAGMTEKSCEAARAALGIENATRMAEADELARVCGLSNGKGASLGTLNSGAKGGSAARVGIVPGGKSKNEDSTVTGNIDHATLEGGATSSTIHSESLGHSESLVSGESKNASSTITEPDSANGSKDGDGLKNFGALSSTDGNSSKVKGESAAESFSSAGSNIWSESKNPSKIDLELTWGEQTTKQEEKSPAKRAVSSSGSTNSVDTGNAVTRAELQAGSSSLSGSNSLPLEERSVAALAPAEADIFQLIHNRIRGTDLFRGTGNGRAPL